MPKSYTFTFTQEEIDQAMEKKSERFAREGRMSDCHRTSAARNPDDPSHIDEIRTLLLEQGPVDVELAASRRSLDM